jgi:uncharacterized RDD family membrane protein YckC
MPQWTKTIRETRHFHAHETARFDALSGLQLASFQQRMYAIAIDLAAIFVFKSLIGFHGFHLHSHEREHVTMLSLLAEAVRKIEDLLEFTVYFAVAIKVTGGRTLGKKLMNVRVVSLIHSEISWWQSTERALGYGASLLEGGFGFVQYFMSRNRQTVHDRIAETIVIDESPNAKRLANEGSEVVAES